MPKSFDHLARPYEWLERATLGSLLWRARLTHLQALTTCEHILVLGEGDGRFLEKVLRTYPTCRVDVLERSEAMVRLAAARVRRAGALGRVRFLRADISEYAPEFRYDAIVTQFVLDCFDEPELGNIIRKMGAALHEHGNWLYADFNIVTTGAVSARNQFHRGLINALYWLFNLITDIRAQRLVDPRPHFTAIGLQRRGQQQYSSGLVQAELWSR